MDILAIIYKVPLSLEDSVPTYFKASAQKQTLSNKNLVVSVV